MEGGKKIQFANFKNVPIKSISALVIFLNEKNSRFSFVSNLITIIDGKAAFKKKLPST